MARLEFSKQLNDMEALVKRFGDKASSDVRAAGLAATGDKGAETGILEGRKAAERLRSNIESTCLDTMLLQQPLVGADLRFVSATFRIVSDLAQIDSMCRDVAFIESELSKKASDRLSDTFMSMSARAAAMVDGAIDAFCTVDVDKARWVISSDDDLDRLYSEAEDIVVELIKAGKPSPKSLPELLMIAKYFERIGDHAQRISDWAVFRATGERILSVGDHDADEVQGE